MSKDGETKESDMANKEVVILSAASFQSEVLEAQTPVLVDFWAPWCGPCRAIAPTIDELAREYSGRVKVAKLNVDEAQDISRRYEVRSIPAIVVFQDGKIVQGLVGAAPKARLAAILEGVLQGEASSLAAS
jgi:thioredoxin 1